MPDPKPKTPDPRPKTPALLLPLPAIRLLLTEQAKNTLDVQGYSRAPVETRDTEGNIWTVATRGEPEPGIYLICETKRFQIDMARTEGKKAQSQIAARLKAIKSLDTSRNAAQTRYLAKYPEDMPDRPPFTFEHDDQLFQFRRELTHWQSEANKWAALGKEEERTELRFALDLSDVVIGVVRR